MTHRAFFFLYCINSNNFGHKFTYLLYIYLTVTPNRCYRSLKLHYYKKRKKKEGLCISIKVLIDEQTSQESDISYFHDEIACCFLVCRFFFFLQSDLLDSDTQVFYKPEHFVIWPFLLWTATWRSICQKNKVRKCDIPGFCLNECICQNKYSV